MKKIFLLLSIFAACFGFVFADEQGDEYDDGYVYETNDAGDQYLKVSIMPYIPLNFGDKVYVGGAAELGYYRFINRWVALGGEVSFSFNVTIGTNTLTTVPIMFGAIFQPSIGKFEFPISAAFGLAYESAQNNNYFPGFALKADVGAYYRVGEAWSFGLACKIYWLPQWYKDPKYNDNGFFLAPALTLRYHF